MKIVVFGATGGAGQELVNLALEAGHEVTAVARDPAKVSVKHERLKVAKGDVGDAASVAAAIAGQEAVVLSVGPRPGTPPGTLISDATRYALEGMRAHGVKRLLLVSGLMVGPGAGLGPLGRLGLSLFRRLNAALYWDKVKAEELVKGSEADWTIVRPPVFGEAPARGRHRLGVDLDVKWMTKMSNRDVAAGLLAALTDPGTVRQALELSD